MQFFDSQAQVTSRPSQYRFSPDWYRTKMGSMHSSRPPPNCSSRTRAPTSPRCPAARTPTSTKLYLSTTRSRSIPVPVIHARLVSPPQIHGSGATMLKLRHRSRNRHSRLINSANLIPIRPFYTLLIRFQIIRFYEQCFVV